MMQKGQKRLQPGEDAAPNPSGMAIRINRIGTSVQIRLQCGGEYQAIELYDRLVEGAQNGKVLIEMIKT